ncbi:MAG: 16S rRNA (cytidine(1402)-2'-O)-methyltransferase [Armatimonadetes bacterium]|nr:16S rRNA (cytidine(1402)-2'-O)-methyltransferase [Armatimonadota bacterium]
MTNPQRRRSADTVPESTLSVSGQSASDYAEDASSLSAPGPDPNGPGALYVVATPIGNLEDITLRALRILREADLIASEDTRTTLKLLSHYDIHTPLTSYHQHSRGHKAADILHRIEKGASVALVSEAGTPAISDPGHELIRGCIEKELRVIPIPGASALITLLSAAGLSTSAFCFLGFPPRKTLERERFFETLSREPRTMVFYESPNRLRLTLEAMGRKLSGRHICLGRELTKMFEEIWRGTIEDALTEFGTRRPRGEFVVVVEGAAPDTTDVVEVEKEYRRLAAEGMDDKAAVTALANSTGWPRREVYAAILKWKGKK